MADDIRAIRPDNDDDMRALGAQDAIAEEVQEWAERRRIGYSDLWDHDGPREERIGQDEADGD